MIVEFTYEELRTLEDLLDKGGMSGSSIHYKTQKAIFDQIDERARELSALIRKEQQECLEAIQKVQAGTGGTYECYNAIVNLVDQSKKVQVGFADQIRACYSFKEYFQRSHK